MAELGERIRKARTDLHLSQEYVAAYLGLGCQDLDDIESGKRAADVGELGRLSALFLIPEDVLLDGMDAQVPAWLQERGLCEADRREVANLLEFRRAFSSRSKRR